MQVRKQQSELGMEQQTGFKLEKYIKAVYVGQEATVRTGHGTTDWFQTGKVHQGCILSPCLFTLYAEYIL